MNVVLVAKSQKDRQRIAADRALRGRSFTFAQSFTEVIQKSMLQHGEAVLYVCGPSSKHTPAEIEAELFRLKRFIQWGHPGAVIAAASELVGSFATVLGIPLIDDAGNRGISSALTAFLSSAPSQEQRSKTASVGQRKPLSVREATILVGLRGGVSIKAIAANLRISPNTVSTYKTRIMAKFGYTSNAQLLQVHGFDIDESAGE